MMIIVDAPALHQQQFQHLQQMYDSGTPEEDLVAAVRALPSQLQTQLQSSMDNPQVASTVSSLRERFARLLARVQEENNKLSVAGDASADKDAPRVPSGNNTDLHSPSFLEPSFIDVIITNRHPFANA
jgi:hypothetical protein